jgi:LCP family protein required for cell wall assembly
VQGLRAQLVGIVLLIIAMILLGACGQPVFMGLPTPTPDDFVTLSSDGAPVPPFGPFSNVPQPDIMASQSAPAPALAAPASTSATQQLPDEPPVGPAAAWKDTENYLILGTDRRSTDSSWRTDTIMIVGLDRKLHRAAVLSVPRDLYIDIPNYGYGRINQIDYIGEKIQGIGGPALLSQVISTTLGISTKHWMRVEMTGFKQVVDAVGGVTVHLDCPFYEPIFDLTDNAWEYFELPAGDNHLDGEASYWYVRLRLKESDFGRGQRQRQFLWAMRDQILKTNMLPQMPALFVAFSNTFSSDLSIIDIMSLVQFGIGMDAQNVRATGIGLQDLQSYTTEQGAAVLRIANPAHVRAVVDSVWNAPAMIDARHQNVNACAPLPSGAPYVAEGEPVPSPTPVPAANASNGEAALPDQSGNGGG